MFEFFCSTTARSRAACLLLALLLGSGVTLAESADPVVQTIDLASARGSWLETNEVDGAARALHFEEECAVLEQLIDPEERQSAFWRTCTRQCMPQGFCAYLFARDDGIAERSLVLGGWIVDDGRMRMFGTLFLHGPAGQIVNGLPVSFAPPPSPQE
jgi:hypothetical protein